VSFEWDPEKAASNLLAHGVRFAEAVTVFEDSFARITEDPTSFGEQRFVILGLSDQANLLVVVFAHRKPEVVRVISAWKANKRQRQLYEKSRS
jgi:uncharacterized DUF497 family protein